MLTALLSEYSRYLQAEKGVAETTHRGYMGALEGFLALCRERPQSLFLPENWTVASLDRRALEVYLNYLRGERGWKTSSIAQQASALRSFFSFLQRRGYRERNPARSLKPWAPPRDEAPPQGEEDEVMQLFQGVEDTLAGARLLLLLELFYGGALRSTQVYRIRSVRVNRRAGFARILAGGETLQVTLSPGGLERARRYLALRREITRGRRRMPFWLDERGSAITPARLSRQVKLELERVGLPGRPSLLRQLSARHFAERGGDTRSLQKLLGAKRLGSLDRYAPPDYSQVLRQFRSIHPRQEGAD